MWETTKNVLKESHERCKLYLGRDAKFISGWSSSDLEAQTDQ